MSYRQIMQTRFDALPSAVRAGCWMSLSAFAYSASAAIVHHLTQTLPIFEVAFGRNVFGLMFMLPWLMRVGLGALRTSHLGMHAGRGMMSTLNMWCLFGALSLAPVADVAAITFMMPIVASVLAVLILKERTSAKQWMAALIGLAGGLIVIRPGMAGFEPGLLLAVGAVLAGSTIAMMIKTLLRYDSSDTIAAYLFMWHIVYGLIPAILVWTTPALSEWLWLVLLGGLGAVVQRGFNRAMAAADATVALPFNFT
ncbi:MAG: DMT family transporter, partial [Alphaproteobacteria bacterium]